MDKTLRPSYMGTIMRCEASLAHSRGRPDTAGKAAQIGTAQHAVIAGILTNGAGAADYVGETVEGVVITDDHADAVEKCLVYSNNILEGADKHLRMWVEVNLNFDWVTPRGENENGTADLILVNDEELHVIDWKFGRKHVEVVENYQLLMYAFGAHGRFGLRYDYKKVFMHVGQPYTGNFAHWCISTVELIERADTVREYLYRVCKSDISELKFQPGEIQCRFCKAKADCKALADDMFDTIGGDE